MKQICIKEIETWNLTKREINNMLFAGAVFKSKKDFQVIPLNALISHFIIFLNNKLFSLKLDKKIDFAKFLDLVEKGGLKK